MYVYIYSQNDSHSNKHRFSEIRLHPKIAYYRDCFITNYLELIQFGLLLLNCYTETLFDIFLDILLEMVNKHTPQKRKYVPGSHFSFINGLNYAAIQHHSPPTKIYPPPPTTIQNMDYHPAKAKIYPYITFF